jgi:hypothetical protein
MRARVAYAAPESNSGKLLKLEELHSAYRSYVQICINKMISKRVPSISLSGRKDFFPKSNTLTSHLVTSAQIQASNEVKAWIKGLYGRKLKRVVSLTEGLTDHQRMELRCCGKYLICKSGKFGKGKITKEMVSLYWSWVWNPEIVGNQPTVSESSPMWLSEMTCVFGPPEDSTHFCWWLRISSLESYHRIQIPLAFNPYLKTIEGLAKSVLVRKQGGRWTFQFCERKSEEEPKFDGSQGLVGVDVGLNVIAATSDGRLYGKEFKPKFDKLYKRVQTLRSNRYRQELKRDSKRLARLETKLSGMTKTITGTVTNKLVRTYPGFTFVIEDLDLRGCRGQKRFAYRSLHNSLSHKTAVEVVSPAYSSQMCPSCGYLNRGNRHGIKFTCLSCGRKSHADVVGGVNLLGRSGDKQINSCESTSEARSILRGRYLRKRNSPLGRLVHNAPKPNGQRLTTRVSPRKGQAGIALNQA